MKKFYRIGTLFLALALMFALAACNSASSDNSQNPNGSGTNSNETYTLRFAVEAPETSPSSVVYETFAQLMNERTNGRVTVDVTYGGALGKGTEILELCKSGAVDIAIIPKTNTSSYFPVSDILSLPFLSSNSTMSADIIQTLYQYGYLDELDGDLKLLYLQPTASLVLATKAPISTVDDLKGMTISCTSEAMIQVMDATGASGTSIISSEVFMSLETGVIDGCISGPIPILNNSYCEVATNVMNAGLCGDTSFVFMSKATWDKLPADIQVVVKEVSEYAQKLYLDVMYAQTLEALEGIAAKGCNVYTPSDELMATLRELAQPVYNSTVERINSMGYDGDGALAAALKVVERCSAS